MISENTHRSMLYYGYGLPCYDGVKTWFQTQSASSELEMLVGDTGLALNKIENRTYNMSNLMSNKDVGVDDESTMR